MRKDMNTKDLITKGREFCRLFDDSKSETMLKMAACCFEQALAVCSETDYVSRHAVAMFYMRDEQPEENREIALQILEDIAFFYAPSAMMLYLHYTFERQDMERSIFYRRLFDNISTDYEQAFLQALMEELKNDLKSKSHSESNIVAFPKSTSR